MRKFVKGSIKIYTNPDEIHDDAAGRGDYNDQSSLEGEENVYDGDVLGNHCDDGVLDKLHGDSVLDNHCDDDPLDNHCDDEALDNHCDDNVLGNHCDDAFLLYLYDYDGLDNLGDDGELVGLYDDDDDLNDHDLVLNCYSPYLFFKRRSTSCITT